MSTMTPPPRTPAPRPAPAKPRQASGGMTAPPIDPFRVLRRHALGITASVFIGAVVAVIVHFAVDYIYPLYPGEVYFEISTGVVDPTEMGTSEMGVQEDAVTRIATTETILLVSRPVLEEAMKSRDVQEHTEWAKWFIEPGKGFALDDAVDELMEDLSASPLRNSSLFALRWSSHVAKDIPIVLNSISQAYIRQRTEQDLSVFNKNQRVFEDQLTSTNSQIDDLSNQITTFIKDKGLNALDDPRFSQTSIAVTDIVQRINLAQQNMSIIQSALVQTASKLEGTTAPTSEDILRAEQHPMILRYDTDVLAIRTEVARQRDKYPSGHSVLIEMQRRLDSMVKTREGEMKLIIDRNLTAQLKELDDQRQTTIDLMDKLQTEYEAKNLMLSDIAAQTSQFLDMKTRRELLEKKRADDLDLIRQLQLMKLRADASRVQLAQPAQTPREKSFPQPEYTIPLGTLLVVGLTIAGVFIRELTDHRVKSASDLAVVPGARVLGVIPDVEDDPTGADAAEMIVTRYPTSIVAESYRQSAAPIAKAMAMSGHQSLLLVGGLPGCGTSTVATNLAAALAASGRRVILIDGNFRRPGLANALGVSAAGPGLGDLLSKAATLDQAIVKAADGIDLISAGTPANRVFERLHNGLFDSIMAQLRDKYDLIIVDSPPAVVAGDAMVLASKVDAAVLVVRAYQEQRGLVARLINQLNDAHCELLGILLNRARGTAGGYFKKNFATMVEYGQSPAA